MGLSELFETLHHAGLRCIAGKGKVVEVVDSTTVFDDDLPRNRLLVVLDRSHGLEFVLVLDLGIVRGGCVGRHFWLW